MSDTAKQWAKRFYEYESAIETETWYQLEFSVRGANDWAKASPRTFDNVEAARDHIKSAPVRGRGFDYRIVRVELAQYVVEVI